MTIENVLSGVKTPTAMAFLGVDDILVIEKDTGKVQRIVNGELEEPLLDIDVANQVERGLLGIAVSKNLPDNKTYVFLYYTEAEQNQTREEIDGMKEAVQREGSQEDENVNEDEEESGTSGDGSGDSIGDGGEPIGNRLYRYELSENGTKLVNPKLLLDLPYEPGPAHNGGTIAVGGSDNNNVCVIMGNLEGPPLNEGIGNNLAQNIQDGDEPDGRAGINCVTQDGQLVGGKGILDDVHPLDRYYAYGIRNGFGLAFDPVTGNLWDTENGGYDDIGGFDEINLVKHGFNSGFSEITGSSLNDLNKGKFDEDNLIDFDGNGKYSDPELDLGQHVVPTAIVFLNSDVLGKEYENDMFVASFNGRIFHFDLDDSRTKLDLEDELVDKIAETENELEDVTFAKDVGSITDLKVGPDGYLYAVVFGYKTGDIVRIIPK